MVRWVVFVLVTENDSPAAVAENTAATVSDAGEEEVDAGGSRKVEEALLRILG
jgi:hypothetical protein